MVGYKQLRIMIIIYYFIGFLWNYLFRTPKCFLVITCQCSWYIKIIKSLTSLGINVFSEEEFKASFEKVDKDNSGFVTADEVENLLFETYGFPPLEEEVKSKQ